MFSMPKREQKSQTLQLCNLSICCILSSCFKRAAHVHKIEYSEKAVFGGSSCKGRVALSKLSYLRPQRRVVQVWRWHDFGTLIFHSAWRTNGSSHLFCFFATLKFRLQCVKVTTKQVRNHSKKWSMYKWMWFVWQMTNWQFKGVVFLV